MKENVPSRDEIRRSLKNHQGEKSNYNFCFTMYRITELIIDQKSKGVMSTVAEAVVVPAVAGVAVEIVMPVDDVYEKKATPKFC